MLTHRAVDLNDYSTRFVKILHFKTAINEDAFLSCILDPIYRHNLILSKNTPYYLDVLLKNPPEKCNDYLDMLPERWNEILHAAQQLFTEMEQHEYHLQEMKKYKKQFMRYFNYGSSTSKKQKCGTCLDIEPVDFRKVYLDYNATTYLRPEVARVMNKYNKNTNFENPSSNTAQGDYLRELIAEAKRQIAADINVKADNIIFTGSGSESNNLAIKGMAFCRLQEKGHIITSKTEHASVLETMRFLSSIGFKITYLDVDRDGAVSPQAVKKAITDRTFMVCTMAVNNEIGTINPISEIGAICAENDICFMVDAVQGFGKMTLNPEQMGISLLSFSGHKIYGPKGIGGLFVREGLHLIPQIHGGGQEYGLRSGTENVSSILALAAASKLAHSQMEQENNRLKELSDYFLRMVINLEPDVIVNGSLKNRISSNLNIGFPKMDSGALLKNLNKLGINVSSSSSCSSRKNVTSHVLEAIGADTINYAHIRFSFGLGTTKEDLDYVLQQLQNILTWLRQGDEKDQVI
ncbi:aminotransferase class V-fold PLP-dependent enzyme [Paenibacillus sp. LMG 31459]|uniref:Aminotransferase class V-fold PLP-dependent enzyme n=1 Tax=Paenibacillus phytohabitans TaxID=2654978 RepID=A0ABX1YBK3_9BACL|nr:cysteine desulfurase family protein [Paenibacillus phytohabitans]NOU77446.1 aminotransferase class V-fold PLP-dependent enzyme [Paenibacillus phytohabitans]